MSSDEIILKVENISKRFEMYEKPIDRLKQMIFGRFGKRYFKEFWALRNINFEIHRGECVGVIGKNGAGKSTLLQILVGTLAPTTGTVYTKGRIAALLELGSGFNPEFTGHDNVYMNASILGLTREEIDACYQDILDFADIGEFINQPVKTYSSGMMLRLAFAVQIMVKPDILIVDEALAVGDAAFVRKCFAHMEQLIANGTSLFLVSHDIDSVKRLCNRTIFLKDHQCEFDGDSTEAASLYMKYLFPAEYTEEKDHTPEEKMGSTSVETEDKGIHYHPEPGQHSYGCGGGEILDVCMRGIGPNFLLPHSGTVKLDIKCRWNQDVVRQQIAQKGLAPNIILGYAIANDHNIRLFGTNTLVRDIKIDPFAHSSMTVSYELDFPVLQAGNYFLVLALSLGNSNNFVDLIWQDFAIPLHCENSFVKGGFLDIPTKVAVKHCTTVMT